MGIHQQSHRHNTRNQLHFVSKPDPNPMFSPIPDMCNVKNPSRKPNMTEADYHFEISLWTHLNPVGYPHAFQDMLEIFEPQD